MMWKNISAISFATWLWRGLFGLIFFAVCYLTLKPRPQISEVEWLPENAAAFFDLYDNWKNVTGFGVLALAGFLGWPQGWGRKTWSVGRRKALQIIGLCGIVVLMELLQLFIPTRFCDIKDMVAGAFGVLLAALLSKGLLSSSTFRNKEQQDKA
jgi:hypothetical protein